jgi:glycosyltransferase involved in cell wall biosynthesis
MPKISVIIPCYNSFKLMSRCFQALERQSFKDFEVIIVDDCSTDNSYENLLAYQEISQLNMIVLKNSVNCGPGESRNIGIKNANGEWLAFCDSDDWYSIYYLEKMLKKATEKNVDIVMCDFNYAFDDGRLDKCNAMNIFTDSTSKNEFIAYAKASLWLLLVKKALFNSVEIPPLYNGEDVAVVPQLLAKADSIAVEHEALYNYWVRSDSISSIPSINVYRSFEEAFSIIEAAIKNSYPLECEYIGINTMLYGATLNAFKSRVKDSEIIRVTKAFNRKYPSWMKNPYINQLNLRKKLYLKCIYLRLYLINKLYAKLHLLYVKQQNIG